MSEYIAQRDCPSLKGLPPDVDIRTFISKDCGATGISTGTIYLRPGSGLSLHTQPCSTAITVLKGLGIFSVQDRTYSLAAYDSIHIPANAGRWIRNDSEQPLVLHWALATAAANWRFDKPVRASSDEAKLESVIRFREASVYELSPGALFQDLFAARFGSSGICGGYGRFDPGASLPCHMHSYDESITIVEGSARCLVQGAGYELSGYDTAFVPQGKPHRFINESDHPMAMVWVYAGDEPERTLLDAGYCSGKLVWPGATLLAR